MPVRATVRRFRTSDGLELVADVGGQPDAATVVLMHGGGQTRQSWSGAMRALCGAGYRVINYDARGHGDSDWDEQADYALARRAADLRTILEGSAGRVALVGASLGGATAMQYVSDGALPDALVLVDIVPRPNRRGVERIRTFMLANPNGFSSLDEAARAVAAYNPHRQRPADSAGLSRNLRLRADGRYYWHWDPRIVADDLDKDIGEFESAVAGLSRACLPVMLVRGSESDVVDNSGVAELALAVPQLEICEVAGAGHMVAGDRNDAFNTAVLAFLERHMAPGEH